MTLLHSLLKLHGDRQPLEDFLTEVVAALLREYPDLLNRWLNSLGIETSGGETTYQVATQTHYSRLPHHHADSRPDLQINCVSGEARDLIFVESKVASLEGFAQLSRYADHLQVARGFRRRYLIYITRDRSTKTQEDIFKPPIFQSFDTSAIKFIETRWRDFHKVLSKWPSQTYFIRQILEFMELHNMADENYFSPESIIALRHFSLALRSLRVVFESEETARFKAMVGKFGNFESELQNFRKIERENNYWQSGLWNNSFKFFFGMGIAFTPPNSDGYPKMMLRHSIRDESKIFSEYRAVMKKTADEFGWDFYIFEGRTVLEKQQSLATILGEENRIEAARLFFREALDDLEKIIDQHLEGFLVDKM